MMLLLLIGSVFVVLNGFDFVLLIGVMIYFEWV